jgi:predicted dehydrogenase
MIENSKTRVAVIGAGNFGVRPATAAAAHSGTSMVVVADIVEERATELSRVLSCAALGNWKEAATRGDVDVMTVSTPTQYLTETSRLALEAEKHVLATDEVHV